MMACAWLTLGAGRARHVVNRHRREAKHRSGIEEQIEDLKRRVLELEGGTSVCGFCGIDRVEGRCGCSRGSVSA